MSWTKNFKVVNLDGSLSPVGSGKQPDFGFKNYQSPLPDVYTGHPNRIERYNQYEAMDIDPEINAALDTIAEFCTQKNPENNTPFRIDFEEDPTQTESSIINEQLKNWCSLNQFDKRMMKMMRNTIKYGDQIFIRDPETFELFWVDVATVTKIVVNESQGKEPENYFIKDISPNFQNLTVTQPDSSSFTKAPAAGASPNSTTYSQPNSGMTGGSRWQTQVNESSIEAKNIVHLSLTEGLDANWPFGVSVLESVFKVYKQKELLEDAILIYRIQRAPERRVFYIDTGNMPSHLAMQFVERVKNEIHQRRIPTQTGGGTSIMDATYNPMSIHEDYFFPQSADGRGSKVETLPGGENLGQIDDLKFFNNKLLRGLRIPSSYLPTGPDDGSAAVTDGKVTTALIQEHRFNQYCMRLQSSIAATLDKEFKMFLAWRGFQIDNSLFELNFTEPMNFASYRSIDLDLARISSFGQLSETPYLSKRFMLKKYLGLSDSEIKENEMLWREENGEEQPVAATGSDLRNVGVTPGTIAGDMDNFGELDIENIGGEEGAPAPGTVPAGAPPAGTPGTAPPSGAPATSQIPPTPGQIG